MFHFKKTLIAVVSMMLLAPYAGADTVFFQDGGGEVYRSSRKTLKEARAAALAFCKKESAAGKCKVVMESKPNSSGYGAVAESKSTNQMTAGYDTVDGAKEAALQGCAETTATDDVCSITMTFFDDFHASSSPASKVPPRSRTGEVFRYSDNCYNADCVRTFEGGRKVRFQAPYCFDALESKWKWKPDGC